MTEQKPGFFAQLASYPQTFWVANTMEIFERMAWYGFFAVSSLYLTGPVETGALGFTSEQRGQLQAIVPFFLYLLPVLTGALADRYGYKKMFIIAYLVMIVSYYALGQFKTFPTFLVAFMFVAVGAAIFKPVVVGTVARVTNASNSATGFGIFYMMVNIGGFVGPFVAGAVRGMKWEYVFISCSAWAVLNLVIVVFFYKDPSTEASSTSRRTLQKVLDDTVEVLGNLRFFITVFTVLIALMIANQEFSWFSWERCLYFVPIWLVLNFAFDAMLPKGSGVPVSMGGMKRHPLFKRMHCSNWRFALFLLIMSGFWTSFQQIFITMPEYIRDYTDTKPMVDVGRSAFNAIGMPHWIDNLAAIEEPELLTQFDRLVRQARGVDPMVAAEQPTYGELGDMAAELRVRLKESLEDNGLTDEQRVSVEDYLERLREFDPDKFKTLVALGQEIDDLTDAADAANVDHVGAVAAFSKLTNPALAWREAMTDTIIRAHELSDVIARQKRTTELADDPSMQQADLDRLAELAIRLNASKTKEPLVALDLVDGVRTMLQYKVRITAAELAELLLAAVESAPAITDDAVDTAVEAVNRRLGQAGKPQFADSEKPALAAALRTMVEKHGRLVPQVAVAGAVKALSNAHTIEPKDLAIGVRSLAYRATIWDRVDAGRQVNAEHIVNLDALAIVFLQVMISFMMAKFHRFTTMIVGMVIAAVGIGLSAIAGGTMIGPIGGSILVVIVGIVTFAIGEMMASPTSQEYVGRIAPQDKVAVYMGYYFVAVALGNLFSGILSGQLYGKLARDMQRPDLMWMCFGGIMLGTAIVFLLYNVFALPKHASSSLTDNSAG